MAAGLLYFLVRGITEAGPAVPADNAREVLRLEAWLGIDVEGVLQGYILEQEWLVTASNWVYIWGHWPVIILTLAWLHRYHGSAYLTLRNAMFVSGAIGLVIFVAYPVAPPRLLEDGYVDTVTELSRSYRVLQPPALVNKYAAMPSLHVGWNLLVGYFLVRTSRHRVVKILGVVTPILMIAAVVLTANHYILDAVAGAAVALIGLAVATRWRDRADGYGIGHEPGAPDGHRDRRGGRRRLARLLGGGDGVRAFRRGRRLPVGGRPLG